MLEDKVVAGADVRAARVDVGIVAIDNNVGGMASEGLGEKLGRPVEAILRGPRPLRVTVQAVDEDNVNMGVGMGEDTGKLEASDIEIDCSLEGTLRVLQ